MEPPQSIFFKIFFIILPTEDSSVNSIGGWYRWKLLSSVRLSVCVTDDVMLVDKSVGVCYRQSVLVDNKIKSENKKLAGKSVEN